MNSPDPLHIDQPPQTLREMAVDRLRKAIVHGRFASGHRLVERTLCDQLGVSRSVVREAIRYLEAEGLVEIAPRVGPVVATLDWPQAAQIYRIRQMLEADAAADCARKADADVLAALRLAHAGIEAASAGADPQALHDATTGFYRLIFTTAGHDIGWDVVQRLNGRISRLRALTLGSQDRHVSGPARMGRIADAIAAHDADRAAQAVRDHLTEAADIARRLLEQDKPA